MFFRDYKSKIVKGIDEDDLLEGNLNKTLKLEQCDMCALGDTLIQCQCGHSHHGRMYVSVK